MFRDNRFSIIRLLVALLLIGALIAGGVALYHTGQAQGYAAGLSSAGVNPPAQPAPGAPWNYPGYVYRGFWGPHFFPVWPFFGLFFFCGIPLLILFLFGGLFRARWHGHHHWHEGGPHHPGDQPPGAPEQAAVPPDQPAGQ